MKQKKKYLFFYKNYYYYFIYHYKLLLKNQQIGEFELPKEIQQIQNYFIILVAAMVRLEKKKKKRSYEDFLNDNENFGNFFLKNFNFFIYNLDYFSKIKKKNQYLLDPVGKTPITFLHEYCNNILKTNPDYQVKIQGKLIRIFFLYFL